MKKTHYLVVFLFLLAACNNRRIPVSPAAYLGMPKTDYGSLFKDSCTLYSGLGRLAGTPVPIFRNGQLSSLSVHVNEITDFDTAYNVYELANTLEAALGRPRENKETNWAGGSARTICWRKGILEVIYQYHYSQVPGTSGLLYTGDAKVSYSTREVAAN